MSSPPAGRRVFLSQRPPLARSDKDFSGVASYGNPLFVLPAYPSASVQPRKAVSIATRELRDFNPERDFLAYSGGDPFALMAMAVVLADMGHAGCRILRWERKRDTDGVRTNGGYYLDSWMPLRPGALGIGPAEDEA